MTCTMVMVNNSTLPGTRGTINGFSQSMVAILRSLGPAVAANLFYWSELNTDHGKNWVTNQGRDSYARGLFHINAMANQTVQCDNCI